MPSSARSFDMLEHADGDDTVEGLAVHVPVVLQLETHALVKVPLRCPHPGDLQLLLAQRDPGDLDIAGLRHIHRHATPSGTDLQHALTRLEQKLGGNMALLGQLRLVQPNAGRIEIGAGILPVLVQKEIEKLAVQIIVVSHVVLVAIDREMALDLLMRNMQQRNQRVADRCRLFEAVGFQKRDDIEDVALFDDDFPIHVHFTKLEARIPHDRLFRLDVQRTKCQRHARTVAEQQLLAGPGQNSQIAPANKAAEHFLKCGVHTGPRP